MLSVKDMKSNDDDVMYHVRGSAVGWSADRVVPIEGSFFLDEEYLVEKFRRQVGFATWWRDVFLK